MPFSPSVRAIFNLNSSFLSRSKQYSIYYVNVHCMTVLSCSKEKVANLMGCCSIQWKVNKLFSKRYHCYNISNLLCVRFEVSVRNWVFWDVKLCPWVSVLDNLTYQMVMVPPSSQQYSFIASEVDKGEWLAPHTGHVTPAERTTLSAEEENGWTL
jgi:hypothetical protein